MLMSWCNNPTQAASKEAALAIMWESVKRSEATGAANAESLATLSEEVGSAPLPLVT